jgi:hypothetical protein
MVCDLTNHGKRAASTGKDSKNIFMQGDETTFYGGRKKGITILNQSAIPFPIH